MTPVQFAQFAQSLLAVGAYLVGLVWLLTTVFITRSVRP